MAIDFAIRGDGVCERPRDQRPRNLHGCHQAAGISSTFAPLRCRFTPVYSYLA